MQPYDSNPLRARRTLASSALFAAVTLTLCEFAHPTTATAQEPPILTAEELACQKATFTSAVDYVRRSFAARQDCFFDVLRSAVALDVDCGESLENGGTGDPETDDRLDAAQRTLSTDVTRRCIGLDFTNLGFPGFCRNEFVGEYDSLDHEICLLQTSDKVVAKLLDIEHPYPFAVDPPLHPIERTCGDTIGRKASSMFVAELDARTICQQKQLEERLPPTVDCREEEDRLAPATGDDKTDADVVVAHNDVLRGIANSCSNGNLDILGFPFLCEHPDGSVFAVADAVECMFLTHHDELIRYIDVLSPSTTKCGNGEIDFTEDCDDGNTDWKLGEFCRANCSAISQCGDINDDGRITATDALFVLQAAVGLRTCSLEMCDVNGDGQVTATDAAMLLQVAVGLSVALSCPEPLSLTCGNGIIDDGESCDDGDSSWVAGELCNARCNLLLCGDPDDSGTITAGDARYMLLVALSLATCDLEVCDVDSNGAVSSTDVLKVLAVATGQDVELICPRD